jgi:hypothetical protein
MNTKTESKICQNCKNNFDIQSEDFSFYEKIKVPPPTFCPQCRLQRRMVWRNERTLYKRTCELCHKSIISMYHEGVAFPVYCRECWYGDNWDPSSFATDYDLNKNFFEQYREFSKKVPRLAMWQRNVVNSDYSNMTGESKNVYLSASVVKDCENVFYSKCIDNSKDIVDSFNVINSSGGLYENVEAQDNYNSQYLLLCRAAIDSYYCVDCINCSNCFLSSNLRNKKYCIRNVQYSKDEYFKELNKIDLGSRKVREELNKEFEKIKKDAIYRFANMTKCVDVTGNNMLNVKNSKHCFEIYNAEDAKFCFRAFDLKECMDFDYGGSSELLYEYTTGAQKDYNVRFTYSAMESVQNADYIESCRNCSNIFGCISLRSTDYAILNKTYSKEEFLKLREAIIKSMNERPFMDKGGREYKYGEFYPVELSHFSYNETQAQELFPLTREQALEKGYSWKEEEKKEFNITMPSEKIPDNISEVNESILKEALGCAHAGNCSHGCNIAFRLTEYELKFYKQHNIPVPILCPNCRYYERIKVMPVLNLWTRNCMCEKAGHEHGGKCSNKFETAYSPDRPETVYCERCYQQEVY